MEEYKSENDLWKHAQSLEDKRNEIDLKVELQALRELFFDKLPLGEKTGYIENYFNRLEEAIYNKEHVERETFPDDSSDTIDGESSSTGRKRDYKYFSASVFKEQASRHSPLPPQENVDSSRLYEIQDGNAQSQSTESESMESLSEHPGGRGTYHGNMESSDQQG